MLAILSIENWAVVYKILFIITALFHPDINYRKFSVVFSIWLLLTGYVCEHYLSGKYWFMLQTVYELGFILIVGRVFKEYPTVIFILTTQAICFLLLNIYQFQTLVPTWFMPPSDYIWWNIIGFEVILFTLWCREEVYTCIKTQWNVDNIIMLWIVSCFIYLIGNY